MLLQELSKAKKTSQAGGRVNIAFPILVGLVATSWLSTRENVDCDVESVPRGWVCRGIWTLGPSRGNGRVLAVNGEKPNTCASKRKTKKTGFKATMAIFHRSLTY